MGSSAAGERVRGNVALPLHAYDGLRQIPPDWNDSTADYPADKPMHRLFEEWVERQPDAMALAHGEHRLSYAELNRAANRLARHLVSLGAGPDVLVGLCMHRRVEMIIGLLAVLKAGGACAARSGLPQARLTTMMNDVELRILLTTSDLAGELHAMRRANRPCRRGLVRVRGA